MAKAFQARSALCTGLPKNISDLYYIKRSHRKDYKLLILIVSLKVNSVRGQSYWGDQRKFYITVFIIIINMVYYVRELLRRA
jgi:hypothetical protein